MKAQKRRWHWILAAVIIALLIAAYVARVSVGRILFERAVGQNIGGDALAGLPDGLHVGICGSGSPMPDANRAGPCNFIRAGKQTFIIDMGGGAARRLGEMRFQPGDIDAVFLTHFHSDHIDGLGELMLLRWTGGAHTTPLPVYGGEGIVPLVTGLNTAYARDGEYRTAHHGANIMPSSGRGGKAMLITLPEGQNSTVIYQSGGVKVTAFRVPHDPVKPAFGYRFEYGGRSVVISGDTAKSDAVSAACNGCDILIHEALNKDMVGVMEKTFEKHGNKQLAKIMFDIPGYHTSPVEAAEIAKAGKAKMLLLTHIVPILPSRILEPYFLEGVEDVFDGEVVLAKDGMLFSLPAKSKAIEQEMLR